MNKNLVVQINNDGKIHLTYWYSWKDKIAENNIERIKEFNETIGKENGIEVTAEYQGTYDDLIKFTKALLLPMKNLM